MAGVGFIAVPEKDFIDMVKFMVEKGATGTDLYLRLETKRREIEAMDIDTLSSLLSGTSIEIGKLVKEIMADGKVNFSDSFEFIKLGKQLFNVYNSIKMVKDEVSDLTIEEVLCLIINGVKTYEKIANKEAAKLVGPLPNP